MADSEMTSTRNLDRIRAVASLARAVAPGNLALLRGRIADLVPVPIPVEVAYEIVLQSYLFFGYPQTIEALKVLTEALRVKGIMRKHLNAESNSDGRFHQRGEELCRRIYHPNYQQLQENISSFSPELAKWMVTEGYGKVLSRPGPTAIEREIASIVFLICSNHPVQLYSHIRGAKNIGASKEEIVTAIESSGVSADSAIMAKEIVGKVFAR